MTKQTSQIVVLRLALSSFSVNGGTGLDSVLTHGLDMQHDELDLVDTSIELLNFYAYVTHWNNETCVPGLGQD